MAERVLMCEATLANGHDCRRRVPEGAPIALCERNLMAAYVFVSGNMMTDPLERMPYPCPLCGERHGTKQRFGWVCSHCAFGSPTGPALIDKPGAPVVPVVYYIRFGARIKIGFSSKPEQRIASLPHDEVLAMEPGGREMEAIRHGQFSESRVGRTEWFESTQDLLDHIAALRAGASDPWEQLAGWRQQLAEHRAKRPA